MHEAERDPEVRILPHAPPTHRHQGGYHGTETSEAKGPSSSSQVELRTASSSSGARSPSSTASGSHSISSWTTSTGRDASLTGRTSTRSLFDTGGLPRGPSTACVGLSERSTVRSSGRSGNPGCGRSCASLRNKIEAGSSGEAALVPHTRGRGFESPSAYHAHKGIHSGVAQWQSGTLLTSWSGVRVPPPEPVASSDGVGTIHAPEG